jgi:hypothetical protein
MENIDVYFAPYLKFLIFKVLLKTRKDQKDFRLQNSPVNDLGSDFGLLGGPPLQEPEPLERTD